MPDTEPLFVGHTGKKLTVTGLRHDLERIGKRAGVEHCHPHTFRRAFATWALDGGMNLSTLQRCTGHSNLAVMQRYLNQSKAKLRKEHAEHRPADNSLKYCRSDRLRKQRGT